MSLSYFSSEYFFYNYNENLTPKLKRRTVGYAPNQPPPPRFASPVEEEETLDTQEEVDSQEETEEIPTIQKSPGNLFSDGLEELINSVAESDELTDKKKEIVLRRAVKEGEDPDEVEMVLEARFYEKHN